MRLNGEIVQELICSHARGIGKILSLVFLFRYMTDDRTIGTDEVRTVVVQRNQLVA